MHVLELPPLPANASADQAEAWLAAFAQARMPTPQEHAQALLREVEQLRHLADTARRGAADTTRPALNREVLSLLSMQAEQLATECIAQADISDPLPF